MTVLAGIMSTSVYGCNSYEPGPCEEAVPAGQQCLLSVHACGCGTRENCIKTPTGLACVPEGAKKLNGSCSASSECARGLGCVAATGRNLGLCWSHCQEAADCPGGENAGWRCEALDSGGTKVCILNCAPVSRAVCGHEAKCHLDPAGRSSCIRKGSGTTLGQCPSGAPTECDDGYDCVSIASGGKKDNCVRWCIMGTSCPDGRACFRYGDQYKVGAVEYGLCPP